MTAKGSMTVFFSLIMIMLMSLFFSMAETVRYAGLRATADRVTDHAVDNSGSEYNAYLWQRYQILALDEGFGTGGDGLSFLEQRIMQFAQDNADTDWQESNFFRLQPESCEIRSYGYLTDHGGLPVIMQGAACAQKEIGLDIVDFLRGIVEQEEESMEHLPDIGALVEESDTVLEEIRYQEQSVESDGELIEEHDADDLPVHWDNPLEVFRQLASQGILGLVLLREQEVSDRVVDQTALVSVRDCKVGTVTWDREVGIDDRIWFSQYLLRHFQSYGNCSDDGGMNYELEYIIGGGDSDRDNLAGVAARLLLLREGENLAAIWADSVKQQQALGMATALAGFTQNPAVIQLVQLAVIAIWALIESILDVRLLLCGGKVAFIKSPEQWTSELYCLGSYLDNRHVARDSAGGCGYRDYLGILLCLLSGNDLAYRSLDMMACALRSQEIYANCRLDGMLCQWEADITYRADSMFFLFIPLTPGQKHYGFTTCGQISYL